MTAAGRLDQAVVIQRKVVIQDDFGQPIETWTDWRIVKMNKRDVRAEERFRSNQELATETAVFVTHWVNGVLTTDRLITDGKTYDIVGLAEIGRRNGLEITAVAMRV
jgi:SPP1 family predicted phage head-tail adaptor